MAILEVRQRQAAAAAALRDPRRDPAIAPRCPGRTSAGPEPCPLDNRVVSWTMPPNMEFPVTQAQTLVTTTPSAPTRTTTTKENA